MVTISPISNAKPAVRAVRLVQVTHLAAPPAHLLKSSSEDLVLQRVDLDCIQTLQERVKLVQQHVSSVILSPTVSAASTDTILMARTCARLATQPNAKTVSELQQLAHLVLAQNSWKAVAVFLQCQAAVLDSTKWAQHPASLVQRDVPLAPPPLV